tara:strand:- start:1099 stop:2292 length:1194 start_codon:yes stop_codon:yes gene_type:complete
MNKEFDLIIFGATGFTGKIAVKYLDDNYPSLNWAISGRNLDKLKKISSNTKKKPSVFVAQSDDRESLANIAKKANVIASLAGPFNKYSDNLVTECINNETHYVDITGENIWVRDLIDKHHLKAEEKGIFIIPSCGYDSIPSDMGTYFCHKILKRPILNIDGYHAGNGGISGGTTETGFTMNDYKTKHKIGNPFLLNPGDKPTKIQKKKSKDTFSIRKINKINRWSAPFVMAIANTRVVRRSASLFEKRQQSYGSNFVYNEYMMTKKFSSAILITLGLAVLSSIMFTPLRKIFRPLFPSPGTGPSEKVQNEGWFESIFIVEDEDNNKFKFRVFGEGDPGYKSTARFICESALSIALDKEKLSKKISGGVLTTASGLGDVLIERLKKSGVLFEGPEKIS